MAENDPSQERTEEATPKRREEAKKKGQIARSKELNTAVILLCGGSGLYFLGLQMARALKDIMEHAFTINRDAVQAADAPLQYFYELMSSGLTLLLPMFLIMFVAALAAPMLLGGWSFSIESLAPKLERMSLLKGIKRMLSMKALTELTKALAKFAVILTIALVVLWNYVERFIALTNIPVTTAIGVGFNLVIWAFLFVSSGLIIIAFFDVPYQLWEHSKQLKMTKQEIKDEYKETEGKPEVKRAIRMAQQEMSRKRMMEKVPQADVVITNPTHYSVAMKYDQGGDSAPIVIAKGKDQVALRIRELASEHHIPIVETPRVARAIYFSTELDQEIPHGLYIAVAQILAYVYQLKRKGAKAPKEAPKALQDLPIPEELER